MILVLCTSPNFTLKSIFIVYFPVNLRREDKLLELILLSINPYAFRCFSCLAVLTSNSNIILNIEVVIMTAISL